MFHSSVTLSSSQVLLMSEGLKPSTRQTSSLGPWNRVAVGAEGVTEPGEREKVRVGEDRLEWMRLGRGGCMTESGRENGWMERG